MKSQFINGELNKVIVHRLDKNFNQLLNLLIDEINESLGNEINAYFIGGEFNTLFLSHKKSYCLITIYESQITAFTVSDTSIAIHSNTITAMIHLPETSLHCSTKLL